MNILEIVGLAFIVVVIMNLASMIIAIKKARLLNEPVNLGNEQET